MNASLRVENVTQIKSGITISVVVSVKMLKKLIHAKKCIPGILLQLPKWGIFSSYNWQFNDYV